MKKEYDLFDEFSENEIKFSFYQREPLATVYMILVTVIAVAQGFLISILL